MTITDAQVQQARALPPWTSPCLSRMARVSFATALKAQGDDTMPALPFTDVWTIRGALEMAGVRFAFDAEDRSSTALPF